MKKVLGNKKAIILFVLPPFLLYTIIVVVPVLWSFYYSLFSGSPGINWKFNGFNNYLNIFRDKNFLDALFVNLRYIAFTMIGQVGGGLLMALMFRFWLKKIQKCCTYHCIFFQRFSLLLL
jgi:raffinose/stachyose/melibiose transport system permease protein